MFDKDKFAATGAAHLNAQALPVMAELFDALMDLPSGQPGLRLRGIPALAALIGKGSVFEDIAKHAIGPAAMPVRALLFDKSATANWSLGWHQDRTICVREKIVTPGYGPWTVKQGAHHVAPPIELLESMITMRVHLDDVPEANAPLLVAPGSHLLGSIREPEIAATVQRCGTLACTAIAGDVWLYSTPILHASEAARIPRRRRVLQIDYASTALPNNLVWAGI